MSRYRREHPRLAIQSPVELRLPCGRTVHAQSVDLSPAGIQLESDRVTRDLVFPQGQPGAPSERPTLSLRIRVPGTLHDEPGGWIEVTVEAVIARRVGEHVYRLGMHFIDVSDETLEALECLAAGPASPK